MKTCPKCIDLAFPRKDCRHDMRDGRRTLINMTVQNIAETLHDAREKITLPVSLETRMIDLANDLVKWKDKL